MAKGRIIQLNYNYGMLQTDSYSIEDEWIPFEIKKNMLVEADGKTYIKYTDEVEFDLVRHQGVRDRDIREAENIRFVGNEWKQMERKIEDGYCQIVRKRLEDYNFLYPELDDQKFLKWLNENKFYPRMLEYLSPGIFTMKKIIKIKSNSNLEPDGEKFKIECLWVMDQIDLTFRKYILSWVTGIENSYKTYFLQISITDNGEDIGEKIINKWLSKKPTLKKIIKRARDKRKYRGISDEFNYLADEDVVPLYDFMEQLDLKELAELVRLFYDEYSGKNNVPSVLEKMEECVNFISDLCAIRNAAAHGRSIIPGFMDPDYNGNWDMEFDNIDERCNVEKWILFPYLEKKWVKMGLGENAKRIINTLYGNPLRRAWIELHYIYHYIIGDIEKVSFGLYKTEACWFLSSEQDETLNGKYVNLYRLRLSDMGNTTLSFSSPPYMEIAQEAFAVWELFK